MCKANFKVYIETKNSWTILEQLFGIWLTKIQLLYKGGFGGFKRELLDFSTTYVVYQNNASRQFLLLFSYPNTTFLFICKFILLADFTFAMNMHISPIRVYTWKNKDESIKVTNVQVLKMNLAWLSS